MGFQNLKGPATHLMMMNRFTSESEEEASSRVLGDLFSFSHVLFCEVFLCGYLIVFLGFSRVVLRIPLTMTCFLSRSPVLRTRG